MTALTPEDRYALRAAITSLECMSVAMKAASAIGAPVERLMERIPDKARAAVQDATRRALERCLDVAIKSLARQRGGASLDNLHKAACAASGALGGFFGTLALPVELPVSTGIMLRSIADIARAEGENLDELEARLACIAVFAFGPHRRDQDEADIGYFAVRAALARALPRLAEKTVPGAFARFLTVIAERFGVAVSEKVLAEALPVVGAAGGGAVNLVFINHFQDVAHGHFTIRRLERKYGETAVREAFAQEKGELAC